MQYKIKDYPKLKSFWFMVVAFIFLGVAIASPSEPKADNYKEKLEMFLDNYESRENETDFEKNYIAGHKFGLVNTEYLNSYFDKPYINDSCGYRGYNYTYGLFSSEWIHINYEKHKLEADNKEDMLVNMENTLVHEIGHFLESKDELGDLPQKLKMELDDEDIDVANLVNYEYYVNLTQDILLEEGNEKVLSSIHFEKIFNGSTCYGAGAYAEETLVRIMAYCIDAKNSYSSELIWKEDNFCDNFDIVSEDLARYEYYLNYFAHSEIMPFSKTFDYD